MVRSFQPRMTAENSMVGMNMVLFIAAFHHHVSRTECCHDEQACAKRSTLIRLRADAA